MERFKIDIRNILSLLITLTLPLFLLLPIFPFLKSATTNESFSELAELGENNMLKIVFIYGFMAFSIFLLSLKVKIFRKAAILSSIFWLLGSGIVFAVLFSDQPKTNEQDLTPTVPAFTGQELFDAVNVYRMEQGVEELTLENKLCSNLAQRYFDIKKGLDEGVAHKGFDEWYQKYVAPYGNYQVSENFAWGRTPQEVIKAWEGSPGHRLSILDPQNTLGCSYASEGYGIIVLGYKLAYQQTSSQSETPSRTGRIISYYEWCTGKDISIYENELITKRSSDGNIYTMTQGDWDCYENFLKNKK